MLRNMGNTVPLGSWREVILSAEPIIYLTSAGRTPALFVGNPRLPAMRPRDGAPE